MDDLSRFRAKVLGEPLLQSRLLAESETDPFIELVVRMAAERDCHVTPDRVLRAIEEARASLIEGCNL